MATIGELIATLGIDTSGLALASKNMKNFERKTQDSINRVNAKLRTTGDSMKKFGRSATMSMTLPLALVAGAAFNVSKNYEASLSKVEGLVGVARDQVQAWGKDIIELATKLGKAPTELADALFFVTSAGIKGANAMKVLESSARASVAGLGETKLVADLVTSAMNAYGPSLLSAAKATDILTAVVREGKAEAPELAASLGQVLPIAAEMEISFNQVGAAVAAMTRTGTNASTAAIQLRQIMASLLKPTKAAEKALNKMGTSSALLRKTIKEKGLLQALMDIRKLTTKYGEEITAKVFPNIRALSGVLDLMGKNAADNIKIFKSLENVTGSADRAFLAASETIKFKWDQSVSEVKTSLTLLGTHIGSTLLPIIQKLSKWILEVSKWFNGLSETTKKVVVVIGFLAAALGPVMVILGVLVGTVLPGLIIIGHKVAMMFVFLKAAIISNPIGALIVALTTVVSLLIVFRKRTNNAEKAQKGLNDEIKITEELTKKPQILDFLRKVGLLQKQTIGKGLFSVDVEQLNMAGGVFKKLTDSIAQLPLGYIKGIKSVVENQITELKRGVLNFVITENSVLDELTLGGFENQISALEEALKVINVELEKSKNLGGAGVFIDPKIKETLTELINREKQLFTLNGLLGNSFDLVSGRTNLYTEALETLISLGVKPTDENVQRLTKRINDLDLNKFTKELPDGLTRMKNLVKPTTDALKDMSHILEEGVAAKAELAQMALAKVEATTITLGGFISGVFQNMSNSISDALNGTENVLQAFGKFFFDFIKGMIIKLVAAAIAAFALAIALEALGLGGGKVFAALGTAATLGETFKAGFKAFGGVGLAQGGIVPEGFPNDSFPARLTSKEAVIPLDRFDSLVNTTPVNNSSMGEEFVAVIKGDDLYIVNTRNEIKRNSIG